MSLFRSPSRKSVPLPTPRDRERRIRDSSIRAGQNRTFSYAANRSAADFNTGREALQNKPPIRRLPSRLQRVQRHFGWLLACVLLVGLIAYEMQLSTTPRIVSLVQASEAPYLQDSAVYAAKASQLFNASAANRNKLTVDASGIAVQLKKQFPELQDVSVSLPLLGSTPTVYIKPAGPALLLSSGGETYLIDENGRAVARATASMSLGKVRVASVTDQSGLKAEVGEQILPRNVTTFITTVVGQLQAQHIAIQSLVLPTSASELDVYVTGQPYYVKFNMHDADANAAALQAGSYVAVSKQLTRQGTTPSQYVDVRLPGRAYYK